MTRATQLDDAALVRLSCEGDPDAFVGLLQRHGEVLRALVSRLINNPEDAADVLQETVLQAWQTLGQLRAPSQVRAWLLQVARNRCRDHFKLQSKHAEMLPPADLEWHANRCGRTAGPTVPAALDALGDVTPLPREAARLHYLAGLSVAEIARSLGSPEGTIKRRLHSAREQMRDLCGIRSNEERTMSLFMIGDEPQPFPERRPAFSVKPLPGPVPDLDWPESRNYFSLVELGDHTMWAIYEPPDWRLYNVYDQRMVREVRIHGLVGLEAVNTVYEEDKEWHPSPGGSTFVRLDDERGQVLGTQGMQGDTWVLRTFLDEGFGDDWWGWVRCLRDTGRFEVREDGSIAQRHAQDDSEDNTGVVGRCLVTVGHREFECVRLLQVPSTPTETDLLMESFVRLDGRLILDRRYNARSWGHARCQAYRDRGPWDEHLPHAERLVVDGVPFIHWYDCFGHIALGIEPD